MTNALRPLKLAIVEDHELARNGLIFAFKTQASFDIVALAENGEKAVQVADEKRPDVVLMDIGLPVLDGIEATQQIKNRFPEMKVIILTSRQENNEVYAALASGADAYCMKDITTERLIEVIKMVFDGAFWLDPSIAKLVLNSLRLKLPQKNKPAAPGRPSFQMNLTERELEVLKLLVEGKNNKEISEELVITVHTVKAHVASIIQKLAVDDRTQAALKALREGIIKQ